MMKRIVVTLLICGMILGLAACGSKDTGVSESNASTNVVQEEVETEAETPVQQPAEEVNAVEEVAEPVAEETPAEVQEPEEVTEEPEVDETSDLSDNDWVIKVLEEENRGVFLIFNSITGERKVLKDSEEYTLQEGDEIAWNRPDGDWHDYDFLPEAFKKRNEEKEQKDYYYSSFMNMDNCRELLTEGEYATIVYEVEDPEGNLVSTTLYLTK